MRSPCWEYLARFRCDPWAEIAVFDDKLKHLPQHPRPAVTRKVGFQPGTYGRTFLMGDRSQDVMPAYQFMRLTEETASPPYCGNTSISGKTLESFATLFADSDPVRTYTLLCRLDSTDLAGRFLTRARVAALAIEIVNELAEIGLIKINAAEGLAAVPEQDSRNDGRAHLARRQLATGLDLLGRMAVRLSPADCDRLLTRALELYRSPAIRVNLSLPKLLSSLIQSLLLGMTPEDIHARLLELMSLPVPGAIDFQVPFPHDWPNFLYLLPDKALGQIRHGTPSGWASQVERLIDSLSTASTETRGYAALRLQRLNEYGCLTKAEDRRFAKALWTQTSPDNGLPSIRPFRPIVVLSLPEPQEGLAQTRVRAYLKSSDILRVRSRTVDPDGTERWTYTQYTDPDSFLLSWLVTTATVQAHKKDKNHFTWKRREIALLFWKIQQWWSQEGRPIIEMIGPSSPFAESMMVEPVRDRLRITLDVLRDVVLAGTAPSSQLAEEVMALIRTMAVLGIATHAIAPALLKVSPGDVRAALESIHRGLVDSDEHIYFQSVRGLIFWLRTQEAAKTRPLGYQLPKPPESLLRQLGCNMASRRQPGLRITLDAVGTILIECPNAVDDALRDSITIGLEKLQNEAAYQKVADEAGLIPGAEIPEYRRKIARLLSIFLPPDTAPPANLAPMCESLKNDPLPEVRAAFLREDDKSD